jgi:hypothetical protein
MKEVFEALKTHFDQNGLTQTLTGGITEGEVPERTIRPYARITAMSESPGVGGLKRTNFHEYITASFEISVVSNQTFEELDAVDVKAVDDLTRYAVLNIAPPVKAIKVFPVDQTYEWSDKYHMAHTRWEAWIAKAANYNRV